MSDRMEFTFNDVRLTVEALPRTAEADTRTVILDWLTQIPGPVLEGLVQQVMQGTGMGTSVADAHLMALRSIAEQT